MKMSVVKASAVAVGTVIVFGSQLVSPMTASAHDTSVGVYDPYTTVRLGYGGVTNSHTRVYSCDTKADGVGVRTFYVLRGGQSGYVDDANGYGGGCSAIYPGSSSNPVARIRVAWKNSGPSTWIYSSWVSA